MFTQVVQKLLTCACILTFGLQPAQSAEVDYKPVGEHLRKAWTEYRKIPPSKQEKFGQDVIREDQSNIRLSLERIYRLQGKDQEANFIGSASNAELEQASSEIDAGKVTDFPKRDTQVAYQVIKRRDNSLVFTSLLAHRIFSIPPEDPNYDEALKLVGTLQVGDYKRVGKLPFKTPDGFSILLNRAETTGK